VLAFRATIGSILLLSWNTTLAQERVPGKVLDLSHWKLTLPISGNHPGRASEILPVELASYRLAPWFEVADDGGVRFRAHCGGVPTKGSKYPRCELRELADGGKPAAWSTSDGGVHTMTATLAITATPPVKRHVVCAQIHDADDDLLMIRLEGGRLLIERNTAGDVLLAPNYRLGTRFTVKIEAAAGQVKVWCDDELKMDWAVSRGGCYFKAGCYTQSLPVNGDQADSFGEVAIYRLHVAHRQCP